jgi:hypothetical protein
VVDEELHQDGQDSQRVDELSGEIVEMHQQLKAFTDRKKLAEEYRNKYKELMKKVKILHDEQQQAFPTELYSQFVEQAKVYQDGKVVYHLSIGVRWSTDERYEEYQHQLLKEKKARQQAKSKEKQEQFLKGPEVKALLEYCEKPRMWGEILEFMNTVMTISASYFRKSIVLPLIEEGKLQKKLLPERQRKHKYYMVKK